MSAKTPYADGEIQQRVLSPRQSWAFDADTRVRHQGLLAPSTPRHLALSGHQFAEAEFAGIEDFRHYFNPRRSAVVAMSRIACQEEVAMTIEHPFRETSWSRGFSSVPSREPEYMMLDMLETHGQREAEALASYERVAEEASAGAAVQYLVRLILDDERRHHQVFAEMANELKSFVWEVELESRTPAMADRANPELLQETSRLLAFEKNDSKELRQLRKALREAPKNSLQPLLVDLMLHDTAKHVAILGFIRDYLKDL